MEENCKFISFGSRFGLAAAGVDLVERRIIVMFENSANSVGEMEIDFAASGCADKPDLTILNGSFSTGDGSYRFELKGDDTGKIIYSDNAADTEEFLHEVGVEALRLKIGETITAQINLQSQQSDLEETEIENIHAEISQEILEEVFWEEINQTLEDPFFRSFYDDSEWGEEFACELGTAEEFEEFLDLCVLTERGIGSPDDYLFVEAETEFEEAGLSECSYSTERLEELVKIACEYFKPTGFRYDYNDGCYDRFSGYSMSSESVSISLLESSKTPAREKMLGMTKLREKLFEMNVPTETIEKLTAF